MAKETCECEWWGMDLCTNVWASGGAAEGAEAVSHFGKQCCGINQDCLKERALPCLCPWVSVVYNNLKCWRSYFLLFYRSTNFEACLSGVGHQYFRKWPIWQEGKFSLADEFRLGLPPSASRGEGFSLVLMKETWAPFTVLTGPCLRSLLAAWKCPRGLP